MAERTAREMAIQRAAQALKGKDATMIYQSPAMLERQERMLKKYNLNPDDFRGLQPDLGRARQQKADEFRSDEKIRRDVGRLASQGIQVDPSTLRAAADKAAATQVSVTDTLPFGVRGAYGHDTGNVYISDAIQNPRDVDAQGSWQGQRTLRHELEHAYDEAAGLAGMQAPLLDRLGAHKADHDHGPGGHTHGPETHDHTDHSSDAAVFNRGHMRIGVMHMRDDTGKQFLDGKDLQNILKLDKGRNSRVYLERMMQSNPGMSLDKLAQLINQVAVRERAVAGAQA